MGAYDDGVPVGLGGPRQRAVLARLLVARGAVVSTDTLIEDLYGDAPPPSVVGTLQAYVSNLRRAVEPGRPPRTLPRLLIGRPPGYLLATTDVDAIRFAELVDRSEFRPPEEAFTDLEEALRLWRGVPYGEFSGELWASSEVNRLCELRLTAVERRAQAQLDLGRPHAAIADLEAETSANPLRERLWCLLALSLYRTGRQADALAMLRRARDLFADQLGLDPGPELRTLEDAILRQAESLMLVPPVPVLPVPVASSPRRRLPHGRERQLAELRTLLKRGDLTTVAVGGEPGIGKTWLLETFRRDCADSGHLVLWGRCPEAEGTPPLWPWLQILRSLARICPPPDRQALAGLLDDEPPAGTTEAARLRRHKAIADWLTAAALSQPVVITLDDLHWADIASLRLLGDVVALIEDSAGPTPITLVTAFRDGADRLPLEDVLGRLARYDLFHLRLTGLEPGSIQIISKEMGVEMDECTARRVTRRTGGNPLFVRETVRMLAQGGTLNAVPGAVADLIRRRLATLGTRAGDVLAVAAVIGREFDPDVVSRVCRAEAYDSLDQATRAGLLVPHASPMAFVHDLVRETLLDGIPPLRRAKIHREVMAVLATRPGVDVSVIAHHAVEAGPTAYDEAARWSRAAAEQASLRLAYEEAALWWGRAVEAHGACSSDPVDHVELLLRQVRALLEAGDALGARKARAQAIRVADRAAERGGPALVARALTALDAPSVWTLRNPYEEVELRLVHRFEVALASLPPGDSTERARLLGGLAQELYDGTENPRCDSLSAAAVETARRLGDPHLLMQTLSARQLSLPQSTHSRELLEIATELLDLASRTRTPGFELLAQMLFTHHRLELSDVAGADEAAACCDAILERLPLPWPYFQHTMWRAGRLALAGRFDDAEALYGEAEQRAGGIGMWYAGAVVATGRILLHYQRGSMADTGPLIDSITGIHRTMDHDARILQLCAQGRTAEAWKLAESGWPSPPRDWSWLTMTCLQGAAQAALGDVPACQVSYSALLPHSGKISVGSAIAPIGPVDWFLALLASALGDHGTATRHLVALVRQTSRTGLPAWRERAMTAAGFISPTWWSTPLREPGHVR
ncbi:DNA-binding SARP family transcriptional activator [Streptosporangium becharense]|uniref:DNA-binding SARP family transcriptional activator n=1 Tax=Streptosporangium becharense TaxID=1816182 RepID=A0A7W9MIS2_9ACTN|nr:AfsR/SARP family transcriptional regulator [Streptosporangium becharense]MBB2913312.1 DNA-binding SARP family transcriptional activator [Streptosporangium becharense]MBB5822295.1 DNA-binding SARP family transcriptional activator [Streptosporangium becharense]